MPLPSVPSSAKKVSHPIISIPMIWKPEILGCIPGEHLREGRKREIPLLPLVGTQRHSEARNFSRVLVGDLLFWGIVGWGELQGCCSKQPMSLAFPDF